MKIILDESVPQKLRLFIEGGHTVVTVLVPRLRAVGGKARMWPHS
jgi:hypothetical protein